MHGPLKSRTRSMLWLNLGPGTYGSGRPGRPDVQRQNHLLHPGLREKNELLLHLSDNPAGYAGLYLEHRERSSPTAPSY